MKVILLRDIKGVGRKYEEKEVSDGYAANKLIPQKLAVAANSPEAKQARVHQSQEASNKAREEQKLKESLAQIANKTIQIELKANDQGHLFVSLNAAKLSKLLMEERGIMLEPESIDLHTPIKKTGIHEIPVSVSKGVETKFLLEIKAT